MTITEVRLPCPECHDPAKARRIVPELESKGETRLAHDSSTNTLIRRYRQQKEKRS